MPELTRALRSVLPRARKGPIRPGASLVRDLGLDSLKVAELSVALEEALDSPVFLGELFADVDDPRRLTVRMLAAYLARGRRQWRR